MGGDGRQRGGASGFAVETFEEGHKAVGLGVGLDVAERNLEQRAVARRAAGDVDPDVQPGGAAFGDHGGGRFRQHQAEFIPERLLGVADLEARDGVKLGGGAVSCTRSELRKGGRNTERVRLPTRGMRLGSPTTKRCIRPKTQRSRQKPPGCCDAIST